MRNLQEDFNWLSTGQNRNDLSDKYLKDKGRSTRDFYANRICDFDYGITFVETSIAREWLERAIKAETEGKADERKKISNWIKGHELIKPDEDSLTQFYPYYIIEQREVEGK